VRVVIGEIADTILSVLGPRRPTRPTRLVGFMDPSFLCPAYDELLGMTDLIKTSGVTWTIIRFTAPKDGPKEDNLRVGFYDTDKIGFQSPPPTSPASPPPRSTTTPSSTPHPPSAVRYTRRSAGAVDLRAEEADQSAESPQQDRT
jgi:hypothetical protein